MKRLFQSALLCLVLASLGRAEQPKVVAVKQFNGIYPASHSLNIPFHGCVVLDAQVPLGDGEHWLPLDHLITDGDFGKIQILVNSAGSILGARTIFKGSLEEWKGARGYASRKRILNCFLGGDGPDLSRELPLAYDGSDFGGMVYTFDESGRVSWRSAQGYSVTDEAKYVAGQEQHKLNCDREGCKNMNTAACVVLPNKQVSGPAAPSGGDKPSN
jgi:hypothetical protein